MYTNRVLALALLTAAAGACVEPIDGTDVDGAAEEALDGGRANVAGKHVHRLTVDGQLREVIVYVPARAAGAAAVPVTFMLHGTSGDGEKFYRISGWKEKADAEGFIAVFPSALTHCLKEDENGDGDFDDAGEHAVTTKWASGELGTPSMPLCSPAELAMLPAALRAQANHPLADDIAYLDAVQELLAARYAVDARRMYASGFSNGAGMTARLALERADRYAALASAAGGLKLPAAPASRPISLVVSVGTIDPGFTAALGVDEIPITATVFDDVPRLRGLVAPFLTMAQVGADYTFATRLDGGRTIGRYTFAGAGNSVTVALIEGLGHQYPNGVNHPVVAADYLWDFFRSRSLP